MFKKFFIFICILIFLAFILFISKNEDNHLGYWRIFKILKKSDPGLSYTPTDGKFHIFLIWKGDSFPDIYLKAFETILFHHPKAEILLFSNELNETLFNIYKKNNYDIHIVRYNLTEMAKNRLGYDFVLKADSLLRGHQIGNLTISNVHLSDFLRYYLVYYYGGLYMDTDMFVLRNLEYLKNAIGVDVEYSYICHDKAYTTKDVKNFACLCNCMFSFEKNHPFLKDALVNYESFWSKHKGYGPGGALMLIKLVENYLGLIRFYDNNIFVCNKYMSIRFDILNSTDFRFDDAIRQCFVLHMYAGGIHRLELILLIPRWSVEFIINLN